FSLVRRALLEESSARSLHDVDPRLGRALADELLEPTAMYVEPLLSMARAGLARSAAHITGGGFRENVPRALPDGLGARVERSAWTPQPIFGLVAEAAGVDVGDLFGVCNMGIGMVVVAPAGQAEEALEAAASAGSSAVVIGSVMERRGLDLV